MIKDPEKRREYMRRYWRENHERLYAQKQEYRASVPKKVKKWKKTYRKNFKKKMYEAGFTTKGKPRRSKREAIARMRGPARDTYIQQRVKEMLGEKAFQDLTKV